MGVEAIIDDIKKNVVELRHHSNRIKKLQNNKNSRNEGKSINQRCVRERSKSRRKPHYASIMLQFLQQYTYIFVIKQETTCKHKRRIVRENEKTRWGGEGVVVWCKWIFTHKGVAVDYHYILSTPSTSKMLSLACNNNIIPKRVVWVVWNFLAVFFYSISLSL